ncbi:Nramp family divalent metal transporter [Kineosporia rhizophila]|uniref:Nramp family divalent metal transporter n=1 Tax=Kineosporia rhizophila TaxID=84633 RepID=UPI001E286EBE|nr:Nramp family divalent metal transporter [Kineosporia rhizophila]MCE0538844.1 Nramp family divalent metal transporter [Kineosporia rhizophila]
MLIRPDRDAGPPVLTADLHPSLYAPRSGPDPSPHHPVVDLRTAEPKPPPRVKLPSKRMLPLLGPAFVASIAYIDPGNFATNISGGATFGYTLIWVVVLANVMAMLVQYLSAKLGLATGRDLAQLCGERTRGPARWFLWGQAELVAMATDLAEFVGAAVALHLLFGIEPLAAGGITAVVSFAVLALRRRGRRPFEIAIVAFLAVVVLAFAYQVLLAGPDAGAFTAGLVPRLEGTESLLLASGIIGATVMPHAVYIHSSMTAQLGQERAGESGPGRLQLLRAQRFDVLTALGIAGLVNLSMMVAAAALLHGTGTDIVGLEDAHAALGIVAGGTAAMVFAVALLSSGLSSAAVGTCAGDVVMAGYLSRRIPSALRRAITMLPALWLLGSGTDTGTALVLSQVVLSFGIPFTLGPLVWFTARRSVMGDYVNRTRTTVCASMVMALIVALNVWLIVSTVAGDGGL